MPNNKLQVIAAIPNYNMADSLAALLPQILAQKYDQVYVLDDASTDHSEAVVASFKGAVTWVGGTTNLGAGGNRNKILAARTTDCIIHFLDADVHLETDNTPAIACTLFSDSQAAFIGGLVKDLNGKQSIWNYGPNSVSLYALIGALIQAAFGEIQAPKPLWRNLLRKATQRARQSWPDIALPPKRQPVYWPIEGNLLVRRSTLEQLGGFDGSVREFDIIPPARKAFELGLVSYFDPSIAVTHRAVNVRHYNRNLAICRELRILIKRYGGVKAYIFPNGHFRPRHNIPDEL